MHSVYVEDAGLSSPLTAEVQFVDCVIGALFLAWAEKPKVAKGNYSCTNHPALWYL